MSEEDESRRETEHGDVQLLDTLGVSPGGPAPVSLDVGELDATAERYDRVALLGRGGMGEVELLRDLRIGREVAMKVIRAGRGSDDAAARFLREARVQAQLEHPAIVPVYDLGLRDDGQIYFTMKRIRGRSLAEIIDAARAGDAELPSRRQLLNAFSQVCLALEYAHERGVLHRDLKPANIMLGDFGEVYVLDWGLAKLADANESAHETISGSAPPETDPFARLASSDDSRETAVGEIIGTPGYMAPEQLRGHVDGRTDVYALGAILFELLALRPLHTGKTVQALMVSALDGVDGRPGVRAPARDIPPELDEVCARATATEPEDRYATVRALHDAVESFLDGDRDQELRARYADDHARTAAEHTERALAGDDEARAGALQAIGRAMGLQPGHPVASDAFVSLLETPPGQMPEETEARVQETASDQLRTAARNGGYGYLSFLLYVPLLGVAGIMNANWMITSVALMVAAGLMSLAIARTRRFEFEGLMILVGTAALGSLSGLFGAYVLLPTVLLGQAISFGMSPRRGMRLLAAVLCSLGVAVPAVLEWMGVIPVMTSFEAGAIVIHPQMLQFDPGSTRIVLLVASVALIVTPVLLASGVREALTRSERRVQLQSWHLQQLIGGVRDKALGGAG